MKKLMIITTVPLTLSEILDGQPKYLSQYYKVVLCSSNSLALANVAIDEGNLEFHTVAMDRGISIFRDLISLLKMLLVLITVRPDVIHSYTPKAGLIAMLAGFICRIPVRVHTFTGLIFPTSFGFKRRILIWIDRLICFCATTVIPEGLGVKKDLLTYKITTKDLNIIGSGNIAGVDTKYFDKKQVESEAAALKQKLMIDGETFVFCFVGRFTLDKGVLELYQAFEQLPFNTCLLLVGSQDDRLPLSESLQTALNSHPRIIQIGWVDDIRPALAISDVFVLPSFREGFPNTPLQAGSMELPSIVTNVNGCNEIIQNDINGWVVELRNSQELANAMKKALHLDKYKLIVMGKESRRQVKLKFERDTYLATLLQFYISLTETCNDETIN
jgi:glycosyltransferase involved in cell wall biosynthesis